MNKLIKERAAAWARNLMRQAPTVPNWRPDATAKLEAAWIAGARSLDGWHRLRIQSATANAYDACRVTISEQQKYIKRLERELETFGCQMAEMSAQEYVEFMSR